jgi:hypothetical protein
MPDRRLLVDGETPGRKHSVGPTHEPDEVDVPVVAS